MTRPDPLKPATAGQKPNIIYLYPDEWRWDGIGALGLSPVKTPHLDQIAAHGVIYSNCYTCAPLCMPARVSMMTGQRVHQHGQWNNLSTRPTNSPSHVRRIRDEAGYLTGVIGKTHLHVSPARTAGKAALQEWGFSYSDEIHGYAESVRDPTTSWTDWLGPEKVARYQQYIKDYDKKHLLSNPWDTQPLDAPPLNFTADDDIDIFIGNRAATWIRDNQDSRPFYLQVNFSGPHYPMSAPSDVRAQFNLADMDLGIKVRPVEPIPPMVKWSGASYCNVQAMTDDQMRQLRLIYYAQQLMIDTGIGKILQALADRGLDDNTWIVMGSDHGELLGDHYLMYKQVFYESSVKIPLVIRPPSTLKTAGWQSAGLTDQLDVTTTILDIAGLTPMFANQGHSLRQQVLAGPADANAQTGRAAVFTEVGSQIKPGEVLERSPGREVVFQQGDTQYRLAMIRTADYKLSAAYGTWEPVELYHLKNDPQELTNLVNHSEYAAVRKQLTQQMQTTFAALE